ncbi:MAG: trimethylamine methyltransferase family protein [Rhodospirillales bacterium]|nr:trimethylamine methyltransferase family protein [Rhodospirillales bacterium]
MAATRRVRQTRRERAAATTGAVILPVPLGGCYCPLDGAGVSAVVDTAFGILEQIGLAAPGGILDSLLAAGAADMRDGRVFFPRSAVEDVLSRAPSTVALPGFLDSTGLQIGGGAVHAGTGGAAVQVLDARDGGYRDSTLDDLSRMMRVLDRCENVSYGLRPLIARDLDNPFELDINTAFACMAGTAKPIGISFDSADHVAPVASMFDKALGGEGRFRRQPFCMAVVVHVVPPLRFAPEGCAVLAEAIGAGMIPQICSAGQAGATSPASLAGSLAQGLAECLAGMMLVEAIRPGHPCIYAFMPFISDLRTGAMSGGSGEAAVASAAAAQLLLHLGLPSTVSAGITDAKIADAQAGYEKGYTVALSAHAGADMINLSVGMLGSIMVASPEALVIDDEMCGAILRSVRGVDLEAGGLDLDAIARVVGGEGHYLGEPETLQLMKTEYVYPRLADRNSVDDWQAAGGTSIWERARARVDEILSSPPSSHLSAAAQTEIRMRFPIRLDP